MTYPLFAEVVFLRRDIRKPFTYRCSSDLIDSGSVLGQPVVVPLGSELTVGVVVEVGTDNDNQQDLKPIRDVIASVDSLPEELVELGKWVSEYYLSPLHSVFRTILPPRYLPEPVPAWTLQNGRKVEELPPPYREIFANQSTISSPALEASRGTSTEEINDLEKDGKLVSDVHYEPPEVNPKKLNYVRLEANSSKIEKCERELSDRQYELLEFLLRHGDQYQKDLPDALRRTTLLQRLEEKGLVSRGKRTYRRDPLPKDQPLKDESSNRVELTREQKQAHDKIIESIRNEIFKVHLIHGVTGSGKTEVYFQLIGNVLERGQSALVLVPEITLASFMISRFRSQFGDQLALLHSGLSQGERFDEWRRVQSGDVRVVLGVQSAVFAPLDELGLIVIDEEHDSSYKSGQSPRYHARDVAVVRGRKNRAPVVLGSATPSLESYTNALRGNYQKHELTTRPLGGELPTVRIVDLKGKSSLLTESLLETTRRVLEKGQRAIWFYNRRGVSNFILCNECGEVVECRHCNVSLTLHGTPKRLRCHYCGFNCDVPDTCPNCQAETLAPIGTGTQTLAARARELFDNTHVIRLDKDTVTRKHARIEKLREFGRSRPCLLVGTQMVTKGLDYKHVKFVGVVMADTGLKFPDYRSAERTFQQLVQVCGRAGRKESGAGVHVQTYNPGHYAILNGKKSDYRSFVTEELKSRKPLKYPPFARLINILARGKQEEDVSSALNRLRQSLPERDTLEWLGPAPCRIDYLKGEYQWHMIARGNLSQDWKRKLQKFVKDHSSGVRLVVNVDPLEVN